MALPMRQRLCHRLGAALLALATTGPAPAAQAVQGAQAGAMPDTRPVPQRADRLPPLPAHWERGVFMEIFVRAYADSDGDGIGDLRGLISRLDYLADLGVRGLWLMPISASADRDHGYATVDHRAIERDYGTLADLDELLRQARRRGIGVIIDYVVNHAAADHPWFRAAREDTSSPWRDWFVWADARPEGWDIWGVDPWYHLASAPWTYKGDLKALPRPESQARGFYFGTFGPHMPDFNLRHGPALRYHQDSLRFWLNRGIAGFRLDAVPHLVENSAQDWNDQPESRAMTKALTDLIRRYPRRMAVCEATAQPQAWGDPAVCGGAFAFGHVQHHVGAALGRAESVQALADYHRTARPTMAGFVSNHDRFAGLRLWDQVAGDDTAYRLAAASYLLQPGTPYVYYGEEIGQAGLADADNRLGDRPLRAPMSWSADERTAGFTTGTPFRELSPNRATHNARAQRADPGSLHAHYKALIGLRNRWPSIARGSFEHSFAEGLVLGFQRALPGERTLVLINYGAEAARVQVPGLAEGMRLQPLFGAEALPQPRPAPAPGQAWTLAPRTAQVWRLLPPR